MLGDNNHFLKKQRFPLCEIKYHICIKGNFPLHIPHKTQFYPNLTPLFDQIFLLLQLAVKTECQSFLESFDLTSVKEGLQVQQCRGFICFVYSNNKFLFGLDGFICISQADICCFRVEIEIAGTIKALIQISQEAHQEVGKRVVRWFQSSLPFNADPGDQIRTNSKSEKKYYSLIMTTQSSILCRWFEDEQYSGGK